MILVSLSGKHGSTPVMYLQLRGCRATDHASWLRLHVDYVVTRMYTHPRSRLLRQAVSTTGVIVITACLSDNRVSAPVMHVELLGCKTGDEVS